MYTTKLRIAVLLVSLGLIIGGCGAPAQPAATIMPTEAPTNTALPPTDTPIPPTDTPIPPTNTPTATFTPEPTETATATPTLLVPLAEERYIVEGGGFSFQAPEGYEVTLTLYSASISDPGSMMSSITLSGSPNESGSTLAELQEEAVQSSAEEEGLEGLVEIGEIIPAAVGGEEALAFDLTISFMFTMNSKIVVATPRDGTQNFTAAVVEMEMGEFGALLGGESGTPEPGASTPQDAFDAILASVQFQEIPESAFLPALDAAKCVVSKDKTFGLTTENPIILYQYPGESRVEDYFAMITGPKGQKVEYMMSGAELEIAQGESQQAEQWSVSYDGLATPVTFYIYETEPMTIDEYQQAPVPVGFTCAKP